MTKLFHTLAVDFLSSNGYYAPMGIDAADLVKAYSVFRDTDHHSHSENDAGHNFYRDQKIVEKMDASDRRSTDGLHYWVWVVLCDSFDYHLKGMLRKETI